MMMKGRGVREGGEGAGVIGWQLLGVAREYLEDGNIRWNGPFKENPFYPSQIIHSSDMGQRMADA